MWISDITYIQKDEGWLYLAGIKDVFTCEIVGYAMGARMTQELVSQYCSHDYRKLNEQLSLRVSMSRRGNCYDNAPMKSFWGSLKNELVHHHRYGSRFEGEASIRE